MNKLTKIILTSLSAVILTTGCMTTTTANNLATQQALITSASATGTALVLQKNPSEAQYFVAGQQFLYSVSSGTNQVTATTVQSLLVASGQTNAIVNLAIENALALSTIYIQNTVGTNNIAAQNTAVKQVAGWIGDGIGQGLAASK